MERTLSANVQFHLWFIYALIGIYLFLPIIQLAFTNPKSRNAFATYLFFWAAGTVLYPTVKILFDIKTDVPQVFNLTYFSGFLGYFVIGGLLKSIQFKKSSRLICSILFIFSTFLIYYSIKRHSFYVGHPYEFFGDYLSPFVVTQAISFFIILKDSKFSFPGEEFLANHTYWMYLIHIIVLERVQSYFNLSIAQYPIFSIPTITLLTFIFSFLISIPLFQVEQIIMRHLK